MSELLSVNGDVLPLLRACEQSEFYGTITVVFEHGRPKDVDVHQRIRLRDQVRLVIKRMLGVTH